MSIVRNILLDLDDTLSDSRAAYEIALKNCCKIFNTRTRLNYSLETFKNLYDKARAQVREDFKNNTSGHSRAMYFKRIVETIFDNPDYSLAYNLLEKYEKTVYKNIKLFPFAKELLKWFKKENKKVILVSDGAVDFRLGKIHTLEISKYIDDLITSEEITFLKPRVELFKAALERNNCKKDESIVIGNRSDRDILGAKKLGLKSVFVNIKNDPIDLPKNNFEQADFEVRNLKDIIGIIENLHNQS